jgi:hypothetical protein
MMPFLFKIAKIVKCVIKFVKVMVVKIMIHIIVLNVVKNIQFMIRYKQFKFIDFMTLGKSVLIDVPLEKN